MVVPNYAYLKLKIPNYAYQCKRDTIECAEANNIDLGASSFPYSMLGKKLLSMTSEQRSIAILDLSSSAPASAPTPAAIIIRS